MNTLFSMEDVHIAYDGVEIVHGVTLHVEAGEFCGLLGLNGSGKTTILHAACGFTPMTGRCEAAGQDCTHLHERKRAQLLSFIPQSCSLSDGKTALEVVMMGFNARLGLLESPSAAQRATALDAMERLGCRAFAERDFGTLSQGQRQVVILARCVVQDTPVMLMDEPDSALDFLNKHMVLEKIRDLIRTEARAGLMTLHDPNFAMAYCTRLLLLKSGALVGEIDMRTADAAEIREKLSRIYGDIALLEHRGSFLMGRSGRQPWETEAGI